MRIALGSGAQQQLSEALTSNPGAYDAYLRGEAAWNASANSDPASLRRAIPYFEQAVARDSTMSEAWSALSRANGLLYNNATPTARLQQAALAAARHAVALDPNGASGHRARGAYHRLVTKDFATSLEEYELAVRAAPTSTAILNDLANVKDDLGRLEESVRDREAAIRLDPRNARLLNTQALTLLRMRRTAEARVNAERGLALAATSMAAIMGRLLVDAVSGNLAGVRQVIASATKDVPVSRVLSYVGNYWDMGWVLDSTSAQQLLALGPEAFDDDHGAWGIVRAQLHYWRSDTTQARVWGDTAARAFAEQLRDAPLDPQRHVLRGLALAYAGRGREGMAESERGRALLRADTSTIHSRTFAYYTYVSARTALVAGDRDKSLELLAEAIRLQYFVTPAWLRIDPTWNAVREDPRFKRILSGP